MAACWQRPQKIDRKAQAACAREKLQPPPSKKRWREGGSQTLAHGRALLLPEHADRCVIGDLHLVPSVSLHLAHSIRIGRNTF